MGAKVNLSIDAAVTLEARALGVNMSRVAEAAIAEAARRLIGLDATRIAAPLREEGVCASLPGLTPSVEVEGRRWIVRLQELAAVPAAELRVRVGSIAAARDAPNCGLDVLIDGF